MTRAVTVRKSLYGALLGGVACAAVVVPSASAQPQPAPPPVDCSAVGITNVINSVTQSLSEYFAAHPETNQAMINITRQPAFVAVGQFDGYFGDHPVEADEIRAIKQPLIDYKNHCGMQVSTAEALTVLSEL